MPFPVIGWGAVEMEFRHESEGHGTPYLSKQGLFVLDSVVEDAVPSHREVCVCGV